MQGTIKQKTIHTEELNHTSALPGLQRGQHDSVTCSDAMIWGEKYADQYLPV